MKEDIRWMQRLGNWTRALNQLSKFMSRTELDELQEKGLIKSFEYNYELAWKTQKDFLEAAGATELFGSKTVVKEAFKAGLINDEEIWVSMITSRNLTAHTYNEDSSKRIVHDIVEHYYDAFSSLHKRLTDLAKKQENE